MDTDKLDKVIKGLTECIADLDCDDCPYENECFNADDDRQYGEQMMRDALELLKEQQKTGKWEEKVDYMGDTYYDCSACGESWTTIEGTPWQNGMNYCPHCGAKMELVK